MLRYRRQTALSRLFFNSRYKEKSFAKINYSRLAVLDKTYYTKLRVKDASLAVAKTQKRKCYVYHCIVCRRAHFSNKDCMH